MIICPHCLKIDLYVFNCTSLALALALAGRLALLGDTTHEIQINDEGLYSVYVTSGQNCKSTDSVTVLWGQSAIYLPNAFTPNGDGLNDEFKPVQKYDFVNTYHISIFSRWGEMIFETADINEGWDGSYKGNPSQQGTYIYKIVFTAWPNKEEQKVVRGSVTLVR